MWQKAVVPVLLLVLGWRILDLGMVLFSENTATGLPQSSAAGIAEQAREPDISALRERRLFGTADGRLVSAAGNPSNAPASGQIALNLRLEGIVEGNPPAAGFALIARNNETGAYRIGDRLPVGNRVILTEIRSNHVVLENNGAREILRLYEEQQAGAAAPAVAPAQTAGMQVGESYDPVALVNQYREKFLANPSIEEFLTLAEIIDISPAQENGNLLGYRIMPGKHLKEFVQLGFETNDIVTRINGIELNDIANLPRLYDVMSQAGRVAVSLIRDGQPLELELALDEE